MRFREHRGSADEAMKTLIVLKDRDALVKHCQALLEPFAFHFEPEDLEVNLYYSFPDVNSRWEKTYVVTIKKCGAIGFTDSAC